MQSRFSWQEVTLILGLCAAVIVAGIYAQAVTPTIGGVVTTLTGWLIGRSVSGKGEKPADTNASATSIHDAPTVPLMRAAPKVEAPVEPEGQ